MKVIELVCFTAVISMMSAAVIAQPAISGSTAGSAQAYEKKQPQIKAILVRLSAEDSVVALSDTFVQIRQVIDVPDLKTSSQILSWDVFTEGKFDYGGYFETDNVSFSESKRVQGWSCRGAAAVISSSEQNQLRVSMSCFLDSVDGSADSPAELAARFNQTFDGFYGNSLYANVMYLPR